MYETKPFEQIYEPEKLEILTVLWTKRVCCKIIKQTWYHNNLLVLNKVCSLIPVSNHMIVRIGYDCLNKQWASLLTKLITVILANLPHIWVLL